MDRSLRTQIERQILKAIAEGKLSGLDGEGQPLPDHSGEAYTDAATQAAVRMMAEAGTLPEEFAIKGLLEKARQSWRDARTEDEKRTAMTRITDLELRYNLAVEARRKFMAP